MIKKLKLLNQDEIFTLLGVQDSNLKAVEKEFKIEITLHHSKDGSAELALSGIHSRVDKAYAKLKKNLDILRQPPLPNTHAYDKVAFAVEVHQQCTCRIYLANLPCAPPPCLFATPFGQPFFTA